MVGGQGVAGQQGVVRPLGQEVKVGEEGEDGTNVVGVHPALK